MPFWTCPHCHQARWRGRHGITRCVPAVAVAVQPHLIDSWAVIYGRAVVLLSAEGRRLVVTSDLPGDYAQARAALDTIAAAHGVPIDFAACQWETD